VVCDDPPPRMRASVCAIAAIDRLSTVKRGYWPPMRLAQNVVRRSPGFDGALALATAVAATRRHVSPKNECIRRLTKFFVPQQIAKQKIL
jgi:hypothetical protein